MLNPHSHSSHACIYRRCITIVILANVVRATPSTPFCLTNLNLDARNSTHNTLLTFLSVTLRAPRQVAFIISTDASINHYGDYEGLACTTFSRTCCHIYDPCVHYPL